MAAMLRRRALFPALALAFIGSAVAEPSATAPAGGKLILGNDSSFRAFLVFKTPVIVTADGQIKVAPDPLGKDGKPIADFQSLLPEADWAKPDFDDSLWDRRHAPVEVAPAGATGHSPAARHSATPNSLICLRSRFIVDDPTKAGGLKLSLEYVGGVAVYLNGQEIKRANLQGQPDGPLAADALAEKYPDDLYVEPGEAFLQDIKKNPGGFERRYRRLANVELPAKALRKGVNVLAIEIHRSPVNEAAEKAKRVAVGGMYVVPGIWAYAGLRNLSLVAPAESAVQPNVARPPAVQAWNATPYQTVQAFDHGDPGEPLRPIVIPAARNGVFSGRLIVSGDKPISGLKVTASELACGQARIPASAIRVRYAVPAETGKSWAPLYRFDGLVDVPAAVPAGKITPPNEDYLGQPIKRPVLSAGSVASLWLTVRVPKDAQPGDYEGTVAASADGLASTSVPLRVSVAAWTLSDPKDMRVRNLGFESAETIARHYGVPLWSDKHFELIGKSLALMAEVNSRQVIAELAIGFHGSGSNDESIIRWIRNGDGYSYDFKPFDALLETVAKSVGKPLPLRLNCWGEVTKTQPPAWANVKSVSLLDPATGKTSPLDQPPPGSAEAVAFWKPVLDEVRKKVEARQWFDVTSIGHNSYCWEPSPLTVDVFKKIWPDGVWSYSAHNGKLGGAFAGVDKKASIPIRYSECVWTEGRLAARGYRELLRPRQEIWNSVARCRHRDYSPLTVLRDLPEEMIMRGHDGVGQLGVDIFPIKNAQGRFYYPAVGRGGLGPDCSTLALLAPGADGPIATERFEMFREGVQLAEAIVFLQRALDEKKIDGELAARVNKLLDARAEAFLQHWSASRFERDRQLLGMAGEVARAAK